tara:strand:- start:3163 stop:4389 length:1227 start_codon:yes stop_codon:yes gene_type:complete
MEDLTHFSVQQATDSFALSTSDLINTIERQQQIEGTLSIADAVCNGGLGATQEAAYGRTELHPSTPMSMAESGILPLSSASYRDKVNKLTGKRLFEHLKLNRISLAETKGYRVRTAYRLIRYMARIRGDLPGFGMVSTSLKDNWTIPEVFNPAVGYAVGTRGIRTLLNAWSLSPNTFTYSDGNAYRTVKGCTYLPPQIPDKFYIEAGAADLNDIWKMRVSRTVPAGYDPMEDEALSYYCHSMEMLAEKLQAAEGTTDEPESGTYGLAGLLSPNTARIAWPTQDEIHMYEDDLCLHLYDLFIEHTSIQLTERTIQSNFGLTRMEAMDLTRMSSEFGANIYREDMEQSRIALINRVGRVADKAESFDIRVTLAAFKEQAKLRGLTRTQESSEMEELRNMATRAADFTELN